MAHTGREGIVRRIWQPPKEWKTKGAWLWWFWLFFIHDGKTKENTPE